MQIFIADLPTVPKGGNNPNVHNWWMDKPSEINPYHGVLSSFKKKWITNTCYLDKPWKTYARWKRLDTLRPLTLWFHLYRISIIGKSIKIKARHWMPRARRGRMQGHEEWLLNWYGLLSAVIKKVLELDCDDSCTILSTYLMHWILHCKLVKTVSFLLYILYHNF